MPLNKDVKFYKGRHNWPDRKTIEFLYRCDQDHFERPWPKQVWFDLGNFKDRYLIAVLELDHKIAGFLLFHMVREDKTAHLVKILVLPSFQNSGLGKYLFFKAVLELSRESINQIYLEVDGHNIGAQKFYQRCGLKKLHTKTDFYGKGLHAASMSGKVFSSLTLMS